MQLTPYTVSTLFQLAGTTACASILFVLASSVGYLYVRKWAWMHALWAAGLVSLSLSFQLPWFRAQGLILYCLAEYAALWMLLAGIREYVGQTPFRIRDTLFLAPMAVYALLGPWLIRDITGVFPIHGFLFGGLAVAAALTLTRVRRRAHEPMLGVHLLRFACGALGALFLHYGLVHGVTLLREQPMWTGYLAWCSLYDALAGFVLAFAMAVAAAENVRIELLRKNARLQAMARRLLDDARTDALTGLLNRRALEDLIEDRERPVRPGCVVVVDLDDLKPINDRHGHAAGDEAIEAVAQAMQEAFRDEDHLFRVGGDEFVIIAPTMPKDVLQRRMAHFESRLSIRTLAHAPDQRGPRASWGFSEYPHHRELELAIAQADAGMYQMKRQRKQGSGSYRRRDNRDAPAPEAASLSARSTSRRSKVTSAAASDNFARELASLVSESGR